MEAGPRRTSPILALPAGYMKLLARDTHLTMHRMIPQPQLAGRAPIVPQAKVLGGGSAINAMVYIRGQAADYDHWDDLLSAGWSYRDLLPHFVKQEDNDHLAGPHHGVGGPLKVSHLGQHCRTSCARAGPAGEGTPTTRTSTVTAGRRRFHAAHHRPGRPPTVQLLDAFRRCSPIRA